MNNKESKIQYTDSEQTVLNNADTLLEAANNMILMTKKAISQAWYIKTQKDKSYASKNPYLEFIDMLEFYINQAKTNYAEYCQQNGIDISQEEKQLVDKSANKEENGKVEPIEQVKKLIME